MIPGVSVALATFNGSRFIDKLFQSLSAQTLPPAELVVTDDNSTSEGKRIAKGYGIFRSEKYTVAGLDVFPTLSVLDCQAVGDFRKSWVERRQREY